MPESLPQPEPEKPASAGAPKPAAATPGSTASPQPSANVPPLGQVKSQYLDTLSRPNIGRTAHILGSGEHPWYQAPLTDINAMVQHLSKQNTIHELWHTIAHTGRIMQGEAPHHDVVRDIFRRALLKQLPFAPNENTSAVLKSNPSLLHHAFTVEGDLEKVPELQEMLRRLVPVPGAANTFIGPPSMNLNLRALISEKRAEGLNIVPYTPPSGKLARLGSGKGMLPIVSGLTAEHDAELRQVPAGKERKDAYNRLQQLSRRGELDTTKPFMPQIAEYLERQHPIKLSDTHQAEWDKLTPKERDKTYETLKRMKAAGEPPLEPDRSIMEQLKERHEALHPTLFNDAHEAELAKLPTGIQSSGKKSDGPREELRRRAQRLRTLGLLNEKETLAAQVERYRKRQRPGSGRNLELFTMEEEAELAKMPQADRMAIRRRAAKQHKQGKLDMDQPILPQVRERPPLLGKLNPAKAAAYKKFLKRIEHLPPEERKRRMREETAKRQRETRQAKRKQEAKAARDARREARKAAKAAQLTPEQIAQQAAQQERERREREEHELRQQRGFRRGSQQTFEEWMSDEAHTTEQSAAGSEEGESLEEGIEDLGYTRAPLLGRPGQPPEDQPPAEGQAGTPPTPSTPLTPEEQRLKDIDDLILKQEQDEKEDKRNEWRKKYGRRPKERDE